LAVQKVCVTADQNALSLFEARSNLYEVLAETCDLDEPTFRAVTLAEDEDDRSVDALEDRCRGDQDDVFVQGQAEVGTGEESRSKQTFGVVEGRFDPKSSALRVDRWSDDRHRCRKFLVGVGRDADLDRL